MRNTDFWTTQFFRHFAECDEIWHAGDLGTVEILDRLRALRPVRGVYWNIDSAELRADLSADLVWDCEGVRVYMVYIGGYPRRRLSFDSELFRPRLRLLNAGDQRWNFDGANCPPRRHDTTIYGGVRQDIRCAGSRTGAARETTCPKPSRPLCPQAPGFMWRSSSAAITIEGPQRKSAGTTGGCSYAVTPTS
jgi:hypothetical protein